MKSERKLQDVKKDAETEIKRLKFMLASSPAVTYASEAFDDFAATFISENVTVVIGYQPSDFLDNPCFWADHIHPDDQEHVFNELNILFEKESHMLDYRFLHKDGSYRWMRDEMKLIRDASGNPLEIVGSWTDITPRKQAQAALAESDKRYRTFMHNFQGIAYRGKMDFTPVFFHGAVEKITGYSEKEFVSGNPTWDKIIFPDDVPKALEDGKKMNTIPNYSYQREYRIIRKDGQIKWVYEVAQNICDESGTPLYLEGTIYDITASKHLEEERLKVQKLESTGVLAGGIAHDFNNMLTAILGNISMAKMFAESNEKVLERLIQAEKASMRAQGLSQQLLTFSRGGEPIKKPTKITELIKDSASFSLTGSNVKCNLFMADKLWPANIDEGQISQVIQNVVKNADQAMPDGGTIIIQAENKTISDQNILPLKDGKYVWIKIKDQGIGIPKKYIPKIFDPYFSTKLEGSGLGLAASFSIIKKHNGFISAESKSGKGTTFHIYLPASEKVSPVKKRAKEKLLQSGEKILIMDDDQAVLEIATQMLNMMGFKTETATNGQEAVVLYRKAQKNGRPFGAVLLDLTIPGGMGGKETVKQLAHIDPEVKAIVSSGYADDPIMADYKNFGFSSVVSKPYDIEKLGEALRGLFG
jgi:PAS domain S-box-containing protein